MQIINLYRYPVKGLSPEPLPSVHLHSGHGFPLDRKYAVTDGSIAFDRAAPQPAQKTHFLMLAKYAELARLKTRMLENPDRLEVRDDERTLVFELEDEKDRVALANYLAGVVNVALPGAPLLVDAPGHQFTDVSVHSTELMRSISLINLTTVADLAEHVGMELDPVRFRANLYFEGAPAWSELDWIGRHLEVGDVLLKVVRRTKRCAATAVNPVTAVRDINLPIAIRDYRDHGDFGFYAQVERGGTISAGDQLLLLPEGLSE